MDVLKECDEIKKLNSKQIHYLNGEWFKKTKIDHSIRIIISIKCICCKLFVTTSVYFVFCPSAFYLSLNDSTTNVPNQDLWFQNEIVRSIVNFCLVLMAIEYSIYFHSHCFLLIIVLVSSIVYIVNCQLWTYEWENW